MAWPTIYIYEVMPENLKMSYLAKIEEGIQSTAKSDVSFKENARMKTISYKVSYWPEYGQQLNRLYPATLDTVDLAQWRIQDLPEEGR